MAAQRGRKSAAAAQISVLADRRASAPDDLNEFQAKLWREIVEAHSADWFRKDTYPLLRSYCKHAWHASEIDDMIAKAFESDDPQERMAIPDLLKARERETRAMLASARSMRITQQAQTESRTAARQKTAPSKKPWERP